MRVHIISDMLMQNDIHRNTSQFCFKSFLEMYPTALLYGVLKLIEGTIWVGFQLVVQTQSHNELTLQFSLHTRFTGAA